MSKKPQLEQKCHKRQHLNIDCHAQLETIKKPRKLINKTSEVSSAFKTTNTTTKSNFYDTIQQVPTYFLSKDQMKADPIELLNKLEEKYSEYGAIKLVANDTWNAPYTFSYVDKEITTRIQHLQKLKQGKAFEQKVRAYRIQAYEAMAKNFSRQYRFKTNPEGKTFQSKVEQEYWNLVTNPEYEKKPVVVEYAADLSTSVYGSGFPVRKITNWLDSDYQYETNYFNLNNISKSPSSLLSICEKRKEKISGISYPWLYMGMLFSSFCWHVEDLFLNSLNYNHKGATKTWYVVPGSYKQKFDAFVQKKFEGNSKKKKILEKIILMIDPKELINQGIKVYKVNQRPREYVCTFYKAYHAGLSHGFNVGEAVNYLSVKSLKAIQEGEKYYNMLERIKDHKPKALVLSKEWLVYENIVQNKLKTFSPENQLYLKRQYEKMLQHEYSFIKQQLIVNNKKQLTKKVNILPNSTKYQKLSCKYCKNYIYLSSIQCQKCGILCQNHIERCKCANETQYEIWIREPNKDRIKTFKEYPVIVQALQESQNKLNSYKAKQRKSRTQAKIDKSSIRSTQEKKLSRRPRSAKSNR